ncbi:MAG: ATP synthase F1 subunit delta [Oscillospiraceae bacterium]|nr:ATP synthase F1 subunit delta [Oscillospiraceae bacterium]
MSEVMCGTFAKAFFETLNPSELEVYDQFECLSVVMEQKAIQEFFANFLVPNEEKLKILENALEKFNPNLIGFLSLLIERNYIKFFEKIWRSFKSIYCEFKGIEEVQVFSAVLLEEKQLQKLKEIFEKKMNKPVKVEALVDDSLLGGLIFKYQGKVLDLSFKNRTKAIRKHFKKQVTDFC